MTKDEFIEWWKIGSNISYATLKEWLKTCRIEKCNCKNKNCDGWIILSDSSIKKRKK